MVEDGSRLASSDSSGEPTPPLDLSRAGYGYLVIATGTGVAFLVLFYFPEDVAYYRLARIVAALGVAVVTGYVYQYVTNTWYEEFSTTGERKR